MVSVLSMFETQKCDLLLALASPCLFVRLKMLPVCLLVGSVSQAHCSGGHFPGCTFCLGRLTLLAGTIHSLRALLTPGWTGTASATTLDDFMLH